ncbi:MAG TPA: hypothetical protein VN648_22890 [Candidatus Methylomirabilis sp.]|nr:hypothetical protein [Candidatus Methylomirabilis sp.]
MKKISEHQSGVGDRETPERAVPGSRWRNALMGVGFLCFLIALFLGASMKEAAGPVPKILAFVGLALIVVSGIASLTACL